ncbi:hypothetical protein H310_14702 [Aphanomyces invadans]|uniref:Alpha-type protein kinase domain-containing protein n=1 Tax=Aphanomyces invadans TaxID=157072 RepID=A0A024TB08_9STRA|nr:hypothetical protein H310_14702 [Aphanomyces invadans]ETV90512.1 hypothetical protein H310_14702 [Aphanomyces invadans]|eukprot:XP_008880828.1 hypothetical protein H310_14702 [Aphanomyces invadans]
MSGTNDDRERLLAMYRQAASAAPAGSTPDTVFQLQQMLAARTTAPPVSQGAMAMYPHVIADPAIAAPVQAPWPPQPAMHASDLEIQRLQAQIAQLQANQRAQVISQMLASPPVAQSPTQPSLDLLRALSSLQQAQSLVPAQPLSVEAQLAQILAPQPPAQPQAQPNMEALLALLARQQTPGGVQAAPSVQEQLALLLASQAPTQPVATSPPKPERSPNRVCVHFLSNHGCRNGDACTFRHEKPNGSPSNPSPPSKATLPKKQVKPFGGKPKDPIICPYFNAPGGCNFKDKCKMLHVVDAKAQAIRDGEIAAFAAAQSNLRENLNKIRDDMKAKYDQANRLDLVIVMDCTSSMGPWIKAAKDAVTTIITNIQTDHPNATVRVGFVGYRDYSSYSSAPLRIETISLTPNTDDVHAFISQLTAGGGRGNFADIPGGLEVALDMPWECDAKVILLVGDAPCHGKLYHDNYRGEMHPSTPCIQEQMRTIARRGIDFRIIEIAPENTAKMVAILQAEYMSTMASDGLERSFASVSLSASGDVVKFGDIVKKISSDSLQASKSRSVISSARKTVGTKSSGIPSLVQIGEDDDEDADSDYDNSAAPSGGAEWAPPTTLTPLNWADVAACPEIAAVRYCVMIRLECNNLAKPVTITTKQATKIKLLTTPFAKGAMRTAHGMQDTTLGLDLIAKFYFGTAATMDHHVREDVEMHAIAKRLATEFSKSPCVENGVDFISTCWYEVAGRPLFTAEPHIPGDYKKYNNNSGWVGDAMADDQVVTAQAFSHFSFEQSKGQLMVVDLQGVGSIFTDPQIHSLNAAKYGHGNLGEAGMATFFATHRCNRICNALRLTPATNRNECRT